MPSSVITVHGGDRDGDAIFGEGGCVVVAGGAGSDGRRVGGGRDVDVVDKTYSSLPSASVDRTASRSGSAKFSTNLAGVS